MNIEQIEKALRQLDFDIAQGVVGELSAPELDAMRKQAEAMRKEIERLKNVLGGNSEEMRP